MKRMLKVTRDEAELRGVPYITFMVYCPKDDKKTVYGFHVIHRHAEGREVMQGRTPLNLPVVQAFENACRFAQQQGISAIWVDDRDQLFEWEQHR